MKDAVFYAIAAIQRIIGLVIPGSVVIIVFLPFCQQKRFGNLVADLNKTVLVEKRLILAQIDGGHMAYLQIARRTDILKLPVLLACVIGQKPFTGLA
ncbi:hypothetical protein ACVS9P_08605 [Caproicibacterium sp. NSD3]